MLYYKFAFIITLSIITLASTTPLEAATTTPSTLEQERKTRLEKLQKSREEKTEKRNDLRIRKDEARIDKLKTLVAKFELNSENIFRSLEIQNSRLTELINVLKQEGKDTAKAEELLRLAQASLLDARSEVKKAVTNAKVELDKGEVSRKSLVSIIEIAQDMRREARLSYKLVVEEIKNIK